VCVPFRKATSEAWTARDGMGGSFRGTETSLHIVLTSVNPPQDYLTWRVLPRRAGSIRADTGYLGGLPEGCREAVLYAISAGVKA